MNTVRMLLAGLALAWLTVSGNTADKMPWEDSANALVIDAYELNIIDWDAMLKDRRIAGFIGKASDGLPESFRCGPGHRADTVAHCRTMWRKYAVSRELYQTRRALAKAQDLLWGAYHLARPGNPIEQANHFLDFARPSEDDLMVLDLEDLNENFMSLEDAEIFAKHIKQRTDRYPVLYTNHSTAKTIAALRHQYPILSRLPLWYARYKPEIAGVFPLGNWENYAIWQFSSMHNCNKSRCPYRVAGTLNDIDVNVVAMDRQELAAAWPFGELVPERPGEAPETQLIASADAEETKPVETLPVEKASVVKASVSATATVPAPANSGAGYVMPDGKSRIALADLPVPTLLEERWNVPEVAGFMAVAMPKMPTEGPRLDEPAEGSAPLVADAARSAGGEAPAEVAKTAAKPATEDAEDDYLSAYAPARGKTRRISRTDPFGLIGVPTPLESAAPQVN